MFKELIERINAEEKFVYRFDPATTDNEKALRSEYNKGLHNAIEIIESLKSKWMDKPNSNGWWYFNCTNLDNSCDSGYYLVDMNRERQVRVGIAHWYSLEEKKGTRFVGKWIKTDPPEM